MYIKPKRREVYCQQQPNNRHHNPNSRMSAIGSLAQKVTTPGEIVPPDDVEKLRAENEALRRELQEVQQSNAEKATKQLTVLRNQRGEIELWYKYYVNLSHSIKEAEEKSTAREKTFLKQAERLAGQVANHYEKIASDFEKEPANLERELQNVFTRYLNPVEEHWKDVMRQRSPAAYVTFVHFLEKYSAALTKPFREQLGRMKTQHEKLKKETAELRKHQKDLGELAVTETITPEKLAGLRSENQICEDIIKNLREKRRLDRARISQLEKELKNFGFVGPLVDDDTSMAATPSDGATTTVRESEDTKPVSCEQDSD